MCVCVCVCVRGGGWDFSTQVFENSLLITPPPLHIHKLWNLQKGRLTSHDDETPLTKIVVLISSISSPKNILVEKIVKHWSSTDYTKGHLAVL